MNAPCPRCGAVDAGRASGLCTTCRAVTSVTADLWQRLAAAGAERDRLAAELAEAREVIEAAAAEYDDQEACIVEQQRELAAAKKRADDLLQNLTILRNHAFEVAGTAATVKEELLKLADPNGGAR